LTTSLTTSYFTSCCEVLAKQYNAYGLYIYPLAYRQTGSFSNIALDYIDQAAALKPFFTHAPTLQGIQKAIEARNNLGPTEKHWSGNYKNNIVESKQAIR